MQPVKFTNRLPLPGNKNTPSARLLTRPVAQGSGFTLIELLVVIAIIAILAALIVGLTGIAGYNKVKHRLATEREQIKGAIEKYHKELGFYPPDNPDPKKSRFSPLYYELTGTTNLTAAQLTVLGVKGIANVEGKNFLPNMKPSGSGEDPVNQRVRLLAVPYGAPSGNINAWNYRSSKPDHNTETYDLWADVVVGGKNLTIANWQD